MALHCPLYARICRFGFGRNADGTNHHSSGVGGHGRAYWNKPAVGFHGRCRRQVSGLCNAPKHWALIMAWGLVEWQLPLMKGREEGLRWMAAIIFDIGISRVFRLQKGRQCSLGQR
ncbi:hypothetical protein SUGI_0057780 [Cryptomeria japonica]|nr:hypothetical protein SUGI_0057780 [Cryptomeria japonica]